MGEDLGSSADGRGLLEIFDLIYASGVPDVTTRPPKRPRRRTKSNERRQPCRLCFYPLSQRHHLLEVAQHGENDCTIQLCANCHELFHITLKAKVDGDRRVFGGYCIGLFTDLWKDGRISQDHLRRHMTLAGLAIRLEYAVHLGEHAKPGSRAKDLVKEISDFLDQVFDHIAQDIDKPVQGSPE